MPKVENANEAVKIAREFLENAGITLNIIVGVTSIDDIWMVKAQTFGARKLVIKIDKNTGEVIEYGEESDSN